MIYFLLLFCGLIGLIVGSFDVSTKKVLTLFFMGLMIFVCAFRYNVGMDFTAYTEIFQFASTHTCAEQETELGFVLLCKLCHYFGGTPQLMFALIGTVSLILIFHCISKFSSDVMFSLFIFLCLGQLYLNSFNAIRQFFAISIFAYSIISIVNRRPIKYVCLLLAAALFHKTSVLLIPLYWLLRCEPNIIRQSLILAFVVFSGPIIIYLILNSPYSMYLTFEMFSSDATIINYIYLFLGAVIFVFQKKLMLGYKHRHIFFNLNFLALILFIYYFIFSGTPLTMVVTRLSYYFVFFYCITIVLILKNIKIFELKSILILSTIIIMAALFIRTTILLGTEYNLSPYQFNFKLFA